MLLSNKLKDNIQFLVDGGLSGRDGARQFSSPPRYNFGGENRSAC